MKKYVLIMLCFFSSSLLAKEPDSLLVSAFVKYDKGNFNQAIEDLTKLIETDPNNALYIQLRAECYFKQNNLVDSETDFLKLEKTGQGPEKLYLAKIYAQKADYVNAANYLQDYLKLKNKVKEADIKNDASFIEFQKSNEWINIWEQEWYSKTDRLLMDAEYMTNYKRFEEALEILDQKIEGGTKNHKIYSTKGDVYYAMEEYELALDEYNKAIKYKKETGYILKRADMQNKLGNYSKAISDYFLVLDKEPYKVSLYKQIAVSFFENKEVETAIFYMEKYLSYYTEDNEALNNFAQILYKNGNYLSALKCYNKLIKYNRNNYNYYIGRGLAYLQTNTYEFAENDFSMALDLNPDIAKTYVNRGIARQKRGDLKGACKDWERAKQMGEPLGIIYLQQFCE